MVDLWTGKKEDGMPQARRELVPYSDKSISMVMWIEIQAGIQAAKQSVEYQLLLGSTALSLHTQFFIGATTLRKSTKVKLVDAIVWVTAQRHRLLLIMRNVKDFSPSASCVRALRCLA